MFYDDVRRLSGLIHAKLLRLSSTELAGEDAAAGKLVNLVTNDVSRFDQVGGHALSSHRSTRCLGSDRMFCLFGSPGIHLLAFHMDGAHGLSDCGGPSSVPSGPVLGHCSFYAVHFFWSSVVYFRQKIADSSHPPTTLHPPGWLATVAGVAIPLGPVHGEHGE